MNKLTSTLWTALALSVAAASGCKTVAYDDPDAVETVSKDFGSTDLKILVDGMVGSLLSDSDLRNIQHASMEGGDPRTVIYFGGVNNRTSEHIDMSGITDSIRVALRKSDEFRIVAGEQGQGEIGEQVRFQQDAGRVDPMLAKEFGRQLGADVVLYGNLRSIEKEARKTKDVWYQFVLEAANITTGEIIWGEERNIRKTEKSGLFR